METIIITEWIYKKDFPHWTLEEEKFVAALTYKVAVEYLNAGMPVAIENVWGPTGLDYLVGSLGAHPKVSSVKAVWLFCDREENHRRDSLRVPEDHVKATLVAIEKLRAIGSF